MEREEKQKQTDQAYRNFGILRDSELIIKDLKHLSNFDLSLHPIGGDGHTDIYEVMRNEGKRAVVIHILRKMETKEERPEKTIDKGVEL